MNLFQTVISSFWMVLTGSCLDHIDWLQLSHGADVNHLTWPDKPEYPKRVFCMILCQQISDPDVPGLLTALNFILSAFLYY